MRAALRNQAGTSLTEVLLVSIIFVVVLGATLTAVTGFDRSTNLTRKQHENAEAAREGLDRLNRQLRNLAKRIDQPVIAIATPTDFMFQTSDPARTWVRWCLEPGAGGGGTARLWLAQRVAGGAAGAPGACPGAGWDRLTAVADGVVNPIGNRSVFTYECLPDRGAGCPASAAEFPQIKGVTSQLFIDANPVKRPGEMLVSSGVYLRNQNETPTAAFSWRPSGTPRRVVFNGAASSDPEGRTLKYYWYKGSTVPAFTCDKGPPPTPTFLQGVTPTHTFPSGDGPVGTTVNFTLVVCDPGDLMSPPVTQGVQIPG